MYVLSADGAAGGECAEIGKFAPCLRAAAVEHRAAAGIEIAGALIETENRVRRDPGEGRVGKGKFRARFTSGALCWWRG